MVSARRWLIALLAVGLLSAGAGAAWLYYGHLPKKAPFRARQVITIQAPCGENGAVPAIPARGENSSRHKEGNSGHTMD